MFRRNLTKKILAMALVFTLTFANFALVTKTYAASFIGAVFVRTGTGSKQVEFEAYFEKDDERETILEADVNDDNLKLNFDLNVNDEGYIKDGLIKITELEENQGLNFKVKDEFENEKVESFENNEFNLVRIEGESSQTIEVPIEYFYEEFITLEKLSKEFKVKFTGIYVDSKAKESELEKEIDLRIDWKEEREFTVESNLTKFFEFEAEGIKISTIQTLIKIDTNTDKKTLPIESIETQIELPDFNGGEITNIDIVPQSTKATDNKTNEEVIFDTDNIIIDEENNLLTIKTENQIQTVLEVENEDEVLKEEGELVEKYFAGKGIDEYLVTYTVENLAFEEGQEINQKIKTVIKSFTGIEDEEENVGKTEKEIEAIYTLSEVVGENISYKVENETQNISKGYAYLNYNSEEKREIEFKTKSIVNISKHELVEEINIIDGQKYYLLKDENKIEASDIFYKNISISKENFEKILGTEGKIEIFDLEENLLGQIVLTEEIQDEYLIANFEGNINKLLIKTSAPITEGNLNINITKVQLNPGYEKETYKNIDSLNEEIIVKAKYKDITEIADVSNETITTKLEDTKTEVNLVLNKESLSTLVKNNDVEFKIELNNHKISSDVFGNSVFEIKLPEYVRSLEVTNVSFVHAEGLEISNAEAVEVDGRIILRVTISGKQNRLSSGIITNGANIILTTNIEIDQFAPAKQEEIKLYYYNEESTNYNEQLEINSLGQTSGISTKTIEYSAPTGVVSVNSISNFDNQNSNVVSINQGTKKGKLDIYSGSKNAKMELIVMNNNSNPISNISLLGRIPFNGIKDIVTNKELGTTIDSKLVSYIKQNSNNNTNFKVYYSENGEASNDLSDSSNGWNLEVNNLDNIKSFLIVPEDENYIMDQATILRFEYEYLIPENLEHNTDIYSSFVTYYSNDGENKEVSAADLVYLTTGAGPQFDIETKIDAKEGISEFETMKITSKVTNTGKDTAYNVNVKIPVPTYTTFIKNINEEGITFKIEENVPSFYIEKLEIGETKEVTIEVEINDVQTEIEEQKAIVEAYSTVIATDLVKQVESEKTQIEIKEAKMKVYLGSENIYWGKILPEGKELEIKLYVQNISNETLNNIITTMKIDEGYEFIEAYTEKMENDETAKTTINGYDSKTRIFTWKLDSLKNPYIEFVKIKLKINKLEEGLTKKEISNIAKTKADGTEEYTSIEKIVTAGAAKLEIKQTSSVQNTYVKEGEKIDYIFSVTNVGTVVAESVKLVDKIPEGLRIANIDYEKNGIKYREVPSSKQEAIVYTNIDPNQTIVVNVSTVASNMGQNDELSVTNSAKVSGQNASEVVSNKITHIVEAKKEEEKLESSDAPASSDGYQGSNGNDGNSNITKTYKITGTTWIDINENGMKDSTEETISGITATLVNSDTGVIKNKLTTNSKGEYIFTGVENGRYLVLFDYDTNLYSVTTYQKEGVATNVNSDVVNTTIEQDGKQRLGAVTDVIIVQDGSVSNIDMGLVHADTFDLKLEKKISKITVQNNQGPQAYNFNNTSVAKAEIRSKYLSGSTVYIEYNIKVSNVGELAGYAKSIVDYIPKDVTFNSGLKGNENWHSGKDGNLYSTSLANTIIGPGESKEIKLILTKQMTDNNVGLTSNTAEIYEDYNVYGITDKNSKTANKIQNENDMSTADAFVGVRTGEIFIYISVIITTLLLGGIIVFLAYNKLILKKRKVGV